MPGEALVDAFVRAAKRGVDVRIIMPGVPDKKLVFRMSRSFYPVLLEAAEGAAPVLADPAPFAAIREYKSGRIDYALRVWCRTEDYWDAVFAVNDRVRSCFAGHGIHMRPDELALRTDTQEINS